MHICIYFCDWLWHNGSIMGSIPGRHTKDSKTVLDASLLNTQQYKVRIKSKV